jgi:hypothetical protein
MSIASEPDTIGVVDFLCFDVHLMVVVKLE